MGFLSKLLGGGGSLPFWDLAAKLPDEAYEWFEQEDCWTVTSGERITGCVGPFRLKVPKLDWKTVYIFGHPDHRGSHSLIEDSQRRFMERYGRGKS